MTVLLTIALLVVIVAAGVAVQRERRRNAALEEELAGRVPRTELQSTLASLEALLEAAPTPVIQFDRAGRRAALQRRRTGGLPGCVGAAAAAAHDR